MKYLALLFALVLGTAVSAQDSWTVTHAGKVLFSAREENREKNILKLAPAISKNNISIAYRQKEATKGWVRTIALFDSSGNELYKRQGSAVAIPDVQLKKWLRSRKGVEVYTWSLPTDPNLAASVRVRRVHLVTLALK